ncbi:MAG: family 20 glycosylhydrolase [Eubacteriales bacterium]|nr:family 20 glycosylhydrolase [Eubacteriales bacterium]MDD4474221.1 family 20 glycosylhydrolase [Eubacteriales bacterium]
MNIKDINLSVLQNVEPKFSKNNKKLVMPECPFQGFKIEIHGSDNTQTVDLCGNIYRPLTDTVVNIIYKAVSLNDSAIFVKAEYNTPVLIKGEYEKEDGDNLKPDVLPSLREWKGGNSLFVLPDPAVIVINDKNLKETANMIADFFGDLLKLKVVVEESDSESGAIFLNLTDKNSELGDEGYYLTITDRVFINSTSIKGILYGGISALQIAYQSKDKRTIPQGTARDYPKYRVRSIMLDVARAWIPLNYLIEMTKYMSYFKINDLHLHINDWGANDYEAFRLESTYEGLAADDGFYTKDEYRAYQKLALKYGIEISTEIDTPGHSRCFRKVQPPIPMISDTLLDIKQPEVITFVKKLIDEYITGDDPVFATRLIDIGTDEFPREYSKEMRVYCDKLIRHINERGARAQLWASFGGPDGYNGETSVCGKARASYAAPGMQDYNTLLEYGFDVINAIMFPLYIVPGGNWNFADYLDYESLYDTWEANWFDTSNKGCALLGEPKFLGAKVCLWNDLYTTNSGFSIFDIFDRLKSGIVILSEKTWSGEKGKSQSSKDFGNKVRKLWNHVPGVNPGRWVYSKSEVICSYDFTLTKDNKAIDNSGNRYDANLVNCNVSSNLIKFDKVGYMSLPFKSIGFPYTVSIDLKLDKYQFENVSLFKGEDGEFFINIDGTGKCGFIREKYKFIFNCQLPINKLFNLKLSCSHRETQLIIDNTFVYDAINQLTHTKKDSSTFVLPVEKIGLGICGELVKLVIVDECTDFHHLLANRNYALNCKASASSYLVEDGRFTADMAVDGVVNRSCQLQFAQGHEQWLELDLGEARDINKFVITFSEHIPEYKIYTSMTGKDNDWTEVYHLTDGEEGIETTDFIDIPLTKARYVKYIQLKMWYVESLNTFYSGGIEEVEVYGFNNDYYNNLLKKADNILQDSHENNEANKKLRFAKEKLKKYLTNKRIYQANLDQLADELGNIINYKRW